MYLIIHKHSYYLAHHDFYLITGGLNEPFKNDQICLLDYMSPEGNANYIFRNLLVISLHLFNALEYFSKKHLVHRDVKRKYRNRVEIYFNSYLSWVVTFLKNHTYEVSTDIIIMYIH